MTEKIDQIIVVDTETTGTSPSEGAALLEVAYVAVVLGEDGAWTTGEGESWLVRHDGDIPPEARAVHHIGPEDVGPGSGAMGRDGIVHSMVSAETPSELYAAHNAPFDQQFLPELRQPWIDTLQCARHLLPDAPRYGNQVLRYYLGLEPRENLVRGLAPHRALYDTAVTAELLRWMLGRASPEELVRLSGEPVLETVCRFGKAHTGKLWSEVPRSYLDWMLHKSDLRDDPVGNRNLLHTAQYWYER